ncbi:MAG TPA: CHAT domain-containing protein, partial [Thermoanaerobaculia bacterium]|nr:CHAT domain-containing protein [Thermoanaerobaculia bacterium]
RLHQSRLPAALKAGNAAMVARLIAPFPKNALEYFEDEILPQGDPEAIALYASVLSTRLGGNRYAMDVAAAATRNREAHGAFRGARSAEEYAKIERAFRDGGSPFHLSAQLERAALLVRDERRLAEALGVLDAIEREARAHGYDYLTALTHSLRGYVLWRRSDYLASIAEYRRAQPLFEAVGDLHHLVNIYRNNVGMYRDVGEYELAWREALLALRHLQYVPAIRIRHAIVGEAASTALALGFLKPAMQLQEFAVLLTRAEIVRIPPEDSAARHEAFVNLASALRGRASIKVHLGDYGGAYADLREAKRLRNDIPADHEANLRAVAALMDEVEGRALLSSNPARAAALFTRAFDNVGPSQLRTFRASLLARRAEAYRELKDFAAAENDLLAALRELHEEERRILERRKLGEGEDIWVGYFSRFDETYQLLIEQLIEQRRHSEAFAHAERARAFEPLDLVLQLDFVPAAFRELVKDGPLTLDEVRRQLPPGTFLLQYSVASERVYTWIVSRNVVRFIAQNVLRGDIERWSGDLQRARRDPIAFSAGLDAPYARLIAAPLEMVRAMNGGADPRRLVIIPDDAMHGLPFAALRDHSTQKHLVETAPIEIDGSATLYVFSLMRDRELPFAGPSALLVGNPHFDPQLPRAHGMKRLQHAVSEVEEIRALYPDVDVLTGEYATVPEFLRLARDKAVVHFAGHSIVNPRQPARSLLLLAPSPEHAGEIEAQELLTQLKLDRTRLVVLAACSSAGGFPVGPEGVAPLVRPLIGAGVPAVLGTLWDVEDATAKHLSVSFHRHYGQGRDAAAALQAAQLDLLRSGNSLLQLPLSWAPFQVIGHASSPFESTQPRANGGTHLGFHRKDSFHRDDGLHPQ